MEKRILFITIFAMAFTAGAVLAEPQLLGYCEYEDGQFWERDYTDGSFDSNVPFTFYEIQVPTDGLLEFTVESEYDSTNDPVIPGSFGSPAHGINILIAQPELGEDAYLDPVWQIPSYDYNVTSGKIVVGVYPDYYFIGGILGPPEGPNYDETTFDYLNIKGNMFFEFTPTEITTGLTPDIIDHVICGGITEDYTPIDIKNSFTSEETMYSLLNLKDMNTGDVVSWTYSGPNEITEIQSLTIEDPGEITVYSVLELSDYNGATGDWLVSIDFNGNLMRADTFVVQEEASGLIPIPGWLAAIGIASSISVLKRRRRN